ncbi:MAG TPA: hypothetical protein VLT33_02445 [Labilithrix sp.]|nr:hypothetical protein [Labilithrix sp.]
MLRRRFAPSLAFTIVLGVAATRCSLTTSLDGYAGDPLPAEAGPTTDATTPDGGDGGTVDASRDSAADAATFCKSLGASAMFCDDFDDEGPFARWTETILRAGGTVARDRAASRSAPSSLLTVAPGSTDHGSALLRFASPAVVRRFRVAYDVRIDARDTETAYAEVGYVRFDPYATFYFRVYGDPTKPATFAAEAYLPDGGIPAHNLDLAGAPTLVDWTHVDVDVDLRAAPHVTVTVDGVLAGDTALEASLYKPAVAVATAGIGYTGAPSSGAWKLRYDNVTIDWEP